MGAVVECHSGYNYAERPKAFYQDHVRFEIDSIESEWRSPDGKHFLVKTRNGCLFELIYLEDSDDWQIRQSSEECGESET